MKSSCWLVIGAGNMGLRHVSHVRRLYPESKIILVSSQNNIQNESSLVVNSIEKALQHEPKYAIISNAAPSHCEVAEILISKGIHCLIEKPLSDCYEKAEALRKMAAKFPEVAVLVGYQMRYKPGFAFLKKKLAHNELGKIFFARASIGHYLPHWRPKSYVNSVSARSVLGGGVLLELSHEFDYLKALFGKPEQITCVSKKASNLELDVVDTAMSIFQYSSGLLVSLHQDMISLPPHRTLEIKAENETLYWDLRNDIIESYSYKDHQLRKIFESDFKKSEQLYLAEIEHFIACADQRVSPQVSLDDACETMKMLEEALFSSKINILEGVKN